MRSLWIVLVMLPLLGAAERFNCRGRILGAYYADAKSGCKAFHVCVRVAGGGIRDFRFFCPPGTLFHQEAQTCTDWGDDDPLACPADLYDGQFDLYKIGSGYDTKKLSSPGSRDDEAEFGLQRAESGDRRSQSSPASDLRAAHSSDFFSGQRDRGRDDPAPPPPRQSPPSSSRQSFRRATTPRAPPTTTQYTTPPPPPPQPSSPAQYEVNKRKLIRKRPVHASTPTPTTFAPSSPQQSFPQQQQQNFNRAPPQNRPILPPDNVSPPANVPPQYKDEYVEVSRVTPKNNKYFIPTSPTPTPFVQATPPQFNKKDGLVEVYNYDAQSTPGLKSQNDNRPFKVRNSFSVQDVPREPDYARNIQINPNSGRVRENPNPTTADYNTAPPRSFSSSTPAYNNFNSVSYEPEKNNFVQFSGNKQKYFKSPTTTAATTAIYTTTRSDYTANLNTVAYNTNIALNTIQPSYNDNGEDDGQYRPPPEEDDGQYRPELYERERELLSGAHSLNIAASGNRLPEDQKHHGKSHINLKPTAQTAAPRPFRPAPTPSVAPQTTRAPEIYTTTYRVPSEQRTFDYFQTYTTTSRPSGPSAPEQQSFNFAPVSVSNSPSRPTTTSAPRTPEPRPQTRAPPSRPAPTAPPAPPVPSVAPSRPSPPPNFARPANNKEDASYDYAYYDSDPGFSEYDHIEEFGKTKTKA